MLLLGRLLDLIETGLGAFNNCPIAISHHHMIFLVHHNGEDMAWPIYIYIAF